MDSIRGGRCTIYNLPGWESALEQLFSHIMKSCKLNLAIDAEAPDSDNEEFELVSSLEGSFSRGEPAKVKALLVETSGNNAGL